MFVFHTEEKENNVDFACEISFQAKYYINDAFGTAHRVHASTAGIAKWVKKAAVGYLIQKEMDVLKNIVEDPKRPYLAVCGGSKISDKIQLIMNLLEVVDEFLIGGAMAFTFLRAIGHSCGLSLIEEEQIPQAQKILNRHSTKLKLPLDFMVTDKFNFPKGEIGKLQVCPFDAIPNHCYALDIGPATIRYFSELFSNARTIFWNGPMGLNEFVATAVGSISIAEAIAKVTGKAITIVGGGDSASIVNDAKLSNGFSHVSTGGGAALSFPQRRNSAGYSGS